MTYWDLLRVICDDDSPEAGDTFSPELNMFINSCLSKEARDRPTVAMLLQHPWFLSNSSVLTAWKQSRRDTVVGSDLLALSSEDEEDEDAKPTSYCSRRSSDLGSPSPLGSARAETKSRLSKLTQRSRSRQRNDITEEGGPCVGSTAVCYGLGDRPLSGEDDREDGGEEEEDDQLLSAVRLEHLQRILEKTDHRYDQMVAMYRQEKELRQQQQQECVGGSERGGEEGGYGRSTRIGERSSFHSMKSSRSFLKAPNDPLVPLPNIYTLSGRRKWNHLARQLHLPSEVITHTASNIINKKYFAKNQEI
jgi:hypothetical protein